ncbi:serine hydrolase domain-containing protein [Terricaulis sp.]|uniref:serine hydrolase domain-containing protein n=1 Tax=Terricaulis sp. TaxID=2768686 RepID=UPI0037844081
MRSEKADARPHSPRRTLVWIGLTATLLLVGWTALVAANLMLGWLHRPLAPRGDTSAFATAAIARIKHENAGNAAFVLLDNGRVVAEHYQSAGERVDRDTLFQVASLSKWLTAWGVMKLAGEGRIDLDAPISTYLTRWRLPDGAFDEDQVTARRLVSHTAGLTDGLGYGGFEPGQTVQRLEHSLTRASDASPGADGRVRVGAKPGDSFLYSGGGYALLQLVIEEVSGEPFNDYMRRAVLSPLGMTHSTFVLPDGATNVAQSFNERGEAAILYTFSAPAAASLYTSAADLTHFLQANIAGADGAPPGRGVLAPEALAEMRRPHAYQYGIETWGLGTILYAPNNAGGFVVGHDGSNTPAINTSARIDPATGDGIILLETGNARLATDIAGEWVFWNTGNVDLFMGAADAQRAFPILVAGWVIILISAIAISVVVAARRRRRHPA